MTKVFLDTVGLIALWDVSDQWHAVATQAYRQIKNADAQLFASRPILLECGNAATRRPYREKVVQLWEAFAEDGTLVEPTEGDWGLAWDAYARGEAGSAGIVDQISFAVMRRLGIRQAFTNDEHFRAAGFETLF
jgi:uncharacterized protein